MPPETETLGAATPPQRDDREGDGNQRATSWIRCRGSYRKIGISGGPVQIPCGMGWTHPIPCIYSKSKFHILDTYSITTPSTLSATTPNLNLATSFSHLRSPNPLTQRPSPPQPSHTPYYSARHFRTPIPNAPPSSS